MFGHAAELDQEVSRQVIGFDLTPFFFPQAEQRSLVVAHENPCVGATDKRAAVA
jgi:hypothetical protein